MLISGVCARAAVLGLVVAAVGSVGGCAADAGTRPQQGNSPVADPSPLAPTPPAADAVPPAARAWMDRLTVKNRYDPATGFIVAEEVIDLPAVLRDAPPLDEAVERARSAGLPVVVFATADRCAPCQQFKKDALNDRRVIDRLGAGRALATHVEVDRRPDLADRYLGGRAIPMTYLLVDGQVRATLRGQRSATDLLDWLNAQGV